MITYVWKKFSVFSISWSIIHFGIYLIIDYEKKISHFYFYHGIIIGIKKCQNVTSLNKRKRNKSNILNKELWATSNDKNNAAFLKVIKYAIQHLFIHQLKKKLHAFPLAILTCPIGQNYIYSVTWWIENFLSQIVFYTIRKLQYWNLCLTEFLNMTV